MSVHIMEVSGVTEEEFKFGLFRTKQSACYREVQMYLVSHASMKVKV